MRPRNKFYEFIWSILRPIFSLLHPLRVEGLENVKIVRNAYAIEYDCINPVQLSATLEF